jgi:hypothetical protein
MARKEAREAKKACGPICSRCPVGLSPGKARAPLDLLDFVPLEAELKAAFPPVVPRPLGPFLY